jgi:hypothetical protein
MKQKFLLQEVIDDLVNTDKSLSAPLMKLNYFSRLIKNQELIDYTINELNGYKAEWDKIPSYRRSVSTLQIDMQLYMNRETRPLPISMLEERYQKAFKYFYVREGIAAVEKIVGELRQSKGDGVLCTPIPMELLHVLEAPARKLYKSDVRIDVVGARVVGNSNIVVEIPNAIRAKLLEFVMSIAESFGHDIEIESFNKKAESNNQTIIHQMSTTINTTGDGNLINTGDKAKIKNKVILYKGDVERLKSELQQQGIEEPDISEVVDVVQSEKPDEKNGRLGEKANSWISKIINKSLNGVGRIATGISANLLATLIKDYYGMVE